MKEAPIDSHETNTMHPNRGQALASVAEASSQHSSPEVSDTEGAEIVEDEVEI